jgi:FlaA1/EpsC-like NDP-sugar epimerase
MKTKALQIRNAVFWALVVFFVALVASPSLANWWRFWEYKRLLLAVIAVVFFALAIALLVLTVKLKEPLIRKIFFILTGASAVCIPIFAILHNLVYGLFYHGKAGEDEAVFFILAIFVCPALFVLGVLGSLVLFISARLRKNAG